MIVCGACGLVMRPRGMLSPFETESRAAKEENELWQEARMGVSGKAIVQGIKCGFVGTIETRFSSSSTSSYAVLPVLTSHFRVLSPPPPRPTLPQAVRLNTRAHHKRQVTPTIITYTCSSVSIPARTANARNVIARTIFSYPQMVLNTSMPFHDKTPGSRTRDIVLVGHNENVFKFLILNSTLCYLLCLL